MAGEEVKSLDDIARSRRRGAVASATLTSEKNKDTEGMSLKEHLNDDNDDVVSTNHSLMRS